MKFSSQSPCYFIPQPLAGDDGDLFTYSLVRVEVEGQASVVLLDNHTRRFLYRLSSHSTLQRWDLGTLWRSCHSCLPSFKYDAVGYKMAYHLLHANTRQTRDSTVHVRTLTPIYLVKPPPREKVRVFKACLLNLSVEASLVAKRTLLAFEFWKKQWSSGVRWVNQVVVFSSERCTPRELWST